MTDPTHAATAPIEAANLPVFGGLEYMRGRLPPARFGPHFHDEYVIGVVAGGGVRATVAGRVVDAEPGDLILTNPGDAHEGETCAVEGMALIDVRPSEAAVRRALGLPDAAPAPRFSTAFLRAPDLAREIVERVATAAAVAFRPVQEHVIADIVEKTFARAGFAAPPERPPSQMRPALIEARRRLDEGVPEQISIEAVARAVGLSPAYFSRSFKAAFGISPAGHVQSRRLALAKRRLQAGDSAGAAGGAGGFHDHSHFHRMFKTAFAVTPGRYARGHRRASAARDGD